MARSTSDRWVVIYGYLAVLAAASIVATMRLPVADTTFTSMMNGSRFVISVAAAIFGFIVWFERRFPLDEPVPQRVD